MNILLFITLFLVTSTSYALNKAEIHVSKMLDTYTSLIGYEDSGNTSIEMISSNGDIRIQKETFATHYIKNSLLKFKWSALPTETDKELYKLTKNKEYLEPKEYLVWNDKTGNYTKYTNKDKRRHKSIATALSSATGVSNGLAWLVPRFVAPEISCPPNLNATKSEILNISNNIISIKQTLPSGTIRILHISRNTYLLSKYESISELQSGTKYHQISEYNVINYK